MLTKSKITMAVITALFSQHALANEVTSSDENTENVVVTATRTAQETLTLASSITVIDREKIENLAPNATSVGDILGKTVPGMATNAQGMSNFTQTIRGRSIQVLIDGVPQSASLRSSSRDLANISANMVERIEIIRGATGIYGQGGAGGVINVITRKASSEPLKFNTKISTKAQSPDVGDSFSTEISQQVSGSTENISYIASAKYASTGLALDADGDAIPVDPHGQGGVADSESYNVYGKINYYLDENQDLELSGVVSRLTQNNDYHTVNGVFGESKATAEEGSVDGIQGQENKAWSINAQYHHDDLLGSKVNVQAYAQSGTARNKYNSTNDAQSVTESDKLGLRFTADTEFESVLAGSVFWGLDLAHEKAAQYMTDGRLWSPDLEQTSVSPFANVRLNLTPDWTVNFGARYDHFDVSSDTFQVNFDSSANIRNNTSKIGNTVEGGDVSYSAATYNIGTTYLLNKNSSIYASFSEGYSLPDVGRLLRDGDADSLEQLDPEPVLVKNYEIGNKNQWKNLETSFAIFYSQSDLALTFEGDANSNNFTAVRAPERIYGLELTADYKINTKWKTGGTFSLQEGKTDTDDNGSYDEYISGTKIAPMKITAFVSNQTTKNWFNQISMLYSGNRDRFDVASYGKAEVNSFVTFDLISRYTLPLGELTFAVANLLNKDYYTVESQFRASNAYYVKANGRSFALNYNLDW